MSKKLRHTAKFKTGDAVINTNLPLFVFEEDNLFYCYCAPLDLYGYGKTEAEAKESFNENLKEFLRYTQNKETLSKELKRLGWKIKGITKKTPQYIAPDFVEMVNNNQDLNRIMTDIPNVKKYSQSVQIPSYA